MRISDWSSDVCSSDLVEAAFHALASTVRHEAATGRPRSDHSIPVAGSYAAPDRTPRQGKTPLGPDDNADHGDHFHLEIGRASCRERCVSTCRSRWSPSNYKKNTKQKTQKNKKN